MGTGAGSHGGAHAVVRKPAPDFKGSAYWNKKMTEISLKQFHGKWVVLFFYPCDFTFVCPTEIIQFSDHAQKFQDVDCQVIGASVDSVFVHREWTLKDRKQGGLGEMNIPLLADPTHAISRAYGALIEDPNDEACGVTMRATYIIDPNGVLRHMHCNDLPVGRNVPEVLRLVQAFQHADKYGEVCPASWNKGDPTMVPDADSQKTKDYFKNANL